MRSRAEVDATLRTAKLNPAELLPAVHCLSFGPQGGVGDCCLLQLEAGLCAELEAGRRYGPGRAGCRALLVCGCDCRGGVKGRGLFKRALTAVWAVLEVLSERWFRFGRFCVEPAVGLAGPCGSLLTLPNLPRLFHQNSSPELAQ